MIRSATATDQPAIRRVLTTIELFPPEILADQMHDYLSNPETEHCWLVHLTGAEVTGFCYAVPEELTDGTYNLLAIGVDAAKQGQGIGKALMRRAERTLREAGKRILLVDTSGTESFAPVRNFYTELGYRQEAVIRDFWAEGDDKVVFWKRLR